MNFITNIRLGHACNSSSTHSILLIPDDEQSPFEHREESEFGWGNFALTDPTNKMSYLGQQIKYQLEQLVGTQLGAKLAEILVNAPVDPEGYVDHQSEIGIPRDWNGKGVDWGFVQAFGNFLRRPDVVVIGGNDNEIDDIFGDYRKHSVNVGPLEQANTNNIVCRQDDDTWTVFNRVTGHRYSMWLGDNGQPQELKRATSPFLVDVKLTDFCPFNCPQCYQGSTINGVHADHDYVNAVVYQLAKLRCFEIAFGGGEPTLWPNFIDVLRTCRYAGIVPNFTTRNLTFLTSQEGKEAAELCGKIAFSVDKFDHLTKLQKAMEFAPWLKDKITIQAIDGVCNFWSFLYQWCQTRNIRLTILGYKSNGRGANFKQVDKGAWQELYKRDRMSNCMLAIDTAIAQQYNLDELGAIKESYHKEEGRYSCYIDAVNKTMAPSSYCEEAKYQPLPDLNKMLSVWNLMDSK